MRRLERLLVLGHDQKVGDICIWLAVLEALHHLSPSTKVTWISKPGVRDIVVGHPAVDQFWDFPESLSLVSRLQMVRRIKQLRPDAVLLLQNNISRKWGQVMFWSRVPIRVGCLNTRRRGRRLTHNIYEPGLEWHEKRSARKALDMLALALDVPVPDSPAKIIFAPETSEKLKAEVDALNLPLNFYILHLGTGGSNRAVDPALFANVAERVQRELGLTPVVTGVESERRLEEEFRRAYSGPMLGLTARTDVPTLAEVARRARFVLAVDTGTVHIGAAVGTPSAVVMPRLSVAPRRWAPWCVSSVIVRPTEFCSGCTRWKCVEGKTTCIETISEEQIFQACCQILIASWTPGESDFSLLNQVEGEIGGAPEGSPRDPELARPANPPGIRA